MSHPHEIMAPVFEHEPRRIKMYNELNKQMELSFNSQGIIGRSQPLRRRRRRLPQAGWWFDQIRSMIGADEVHPVSRPVQTRFQFPPRHKVCNSA